MLLLQKIERLNNLHSQWVDEQILNSKLASFPVKDGRHQPRKFQKMKPILDQDMILKEEAVAKTEMSELLADAEGALVFRQATRTIVFSVLHMQIIWPWH